MTTKAQPKGRPQETKHAPPAKGEGLAGGGDDGGGFMAVPPATTTTTTTTTGGATDAEDDGFRVDPVQLRYLTSTLSFDDNQAIAALKATRSDELR